MSSARALGLGLLLGATAAVAAPATVEEDDPLLEPVEAVLDPEAAVSALQLRRSLEQPGLTPEEAGELPAADAPPPAAAPRVSGRVHLASAASSGDLLAPPVLLAADLRGPWGLSAGVELALSRLRPAPPRWDPGLQALVSSGPGLQLEAPRAYLQWRQGRLRLIAGTFEVGFAERLVLDTTRTASPDGFTLGSTFRRPLRTTLGCHLAGPGREEDPVCQAGRLQTPDFVTREALRGVAAAVEGVPLGGGAEGEAAAFASWQNPRVSQAELQLPGACAAACPPPQVLRASGPTSVVSSSLPGTLEELLLGLHLALRPLPGLTLGATAYGALLRLPGPLGFQRSSRWPATGLLGAAGMHGRWAAGPLVLALEVARSFEGRPGDAGGGFGAVQRAAWSQGPHQLELALRAYDPHFASLHGRPTAASDLEEGQRARNELGARLSWRWRGRQAWSAWVRVDAWANPWPREGARPAWTPGLTAQARLDVRARPWLQATAFGAGGLRAGGCDAGASDEEAPAEPCATGRWKAGLRLELSPPAPIPGLALHAWVAGASSGGPWRTDLLVQAEGRWASPPGLELRLGGRGLLRGAGQGPPVEARLTGWLECRWSPLPGVALGLRYEAWGWLAGPAPSPNPEHRGLLDVTVAW